MQQPLSSKRAEHAARRVLALAAALAVGGVATAACGGSPSASVANLGTSNTTTPTRSPGGVSADSDGGGGQTNAQATIGMGGVSVQFSECMQKHGVPDFPDPNGQGQVTLKGVDPQSPSFETAQRACARYAPNGGKAPSAAQQQKMIAHALKFSECMRSHGISNFPDPEVSTNGAAVSIGIRIRAGGGNLSPQSPQFQAAQKACLGLLNGGAKGAKSNSVAYG